MGMYKEIAITICEMYQRGVDVKQIAATVNVTVNEVMTVITELYPRIKEES